MSMLRRGCFFTKTPSSLPPIQLKLGKGYKSKKSFICCFVNCEATFNKSWKLDAHLCKHSGLKPFSCENRDKRFCIRYQLTRHRLSHSGEKPAHQTQAEPQCLAAGCSEAFATHVSMKTHMAHIHQHQENVGYGKDFKKNNQLKTHQTEHGCKRECAGPGQLKHHEKVHQGYPCAVEGCLQGEIWSAYQKQRKAVHRVKLQCDGCSRMFLEAWFLHQLWVHSGAPKREFQCSKTGCGKTFTTHFNLENHVMSDHKGKKAFSCTHVGCGKSFAMQVSTL
ncbi:general transcription factor IIIA, b [Coregonus clupeaformis]|uniref:general transcription factor IIIA, b n=1 Tax=Coregonus clupeaformis TaxID=59861 RepID=UPI001BE10DDF|nr:general transcription factor IIIA, b [Coregonus clupeaformis]